MTFPEGLRELSHRLTGKCSFVLTASSDVRADVIRQFHEAGKSDMAELLILLDEKEWALQAAIEELSR